MARPRPCTGRRPAVWTPRCVRGIQWPLRTSGRQYALRLGCMGCDQIHELRCQAIVGLEAELLQARTYRTHLLGFGPGFDDGRDEGGELRFLPADFLRQLDVDEIKSVQRVILVLDAAIHVHTATGAGMALNRSAGIP